MVEAESRHRERGKTHGNVLKGACKPGGESWAGRVSQGRVRPGLRAMRSRTDKDCAQ